MKVRYFQIAGGNETALVWGAESKKMKVSIRLLSKVEQVGFIKDKPKYSLGMMGDELCINATLAAGFAFGGEGRISISGRIACYKVGKNEVELSLPLSYRREKNLVIFEDIGYKLVGGNQAIDKKYMKNLCFKYKLPAFGLVKFSDGSINPFVYVKQTDSLVNETACGSGSIALSILSGRQKIIQPTGEFIRISRSNNKFIVRAKVKEINK